MSGARGVGGGCLRRNDAVEGVVAEGLRTCRIQIVRNAVDVAGISLRGGIDKVIRNVEGVTAG